METLQERLNKAVAAQPTEITQTVLAERCGIRQASVSDWFTGKTKSLRGDNLMKVAAFLKVSPRWLGQGAGSMWPSSAESVELINSPLYEEKLTHRGLRIVSRLAEAESGNAANENVYRIIEHALALGLSQPASEQQEITQEEKQGILALYEALPPHRRAALIGFLKSWGE